MSIVILMFTLMIQNFNEPKWILIDEKINVLWSISYDDKLLIN